jgi:AbrB family looped-hinge helix DNA binding protein
MRKQVQEVEFTRASSKGQVVIPTKIRRRLDIREGSVLAVAAEKDMVVLRKVAPSFSVEDLKTLRLVEEAWRDIEKGRYRVRSKEAFFKELKEW